MWSSEWQVSDATIATWISSWSGSSSSRSTTSNFPGVSLIIATRPHCTGLPARLVPRIEGIYAHRPAMSFAMNVELETSLDETLVEHAGRSCGSCLISTSVGRNMMPGRADSPGPCEELCSSRSTRPFPTARGTGHRPAAVSGDPLQNA